MWDRRGENRTGKALPLLQHCEKFPAGHSLHHNVGASLGLDHVVAAGDVLVGELLGYRDLVVKETALFLTETDLVDSLDCELAVGGHLDLFV